MVEIPESMIYFFNLYLHGNQHISSEKLGRVVVSSSILRGGSDEARVSDDETFNTQSSRVERIDGDYESLLRNQELGMLRD